MAPAEQGGRLCGRPQARCGPPAAAGDDRGMPQGAIGERLTGCRDDSSAPRPEGWLAGRRGLRPHSCRKHVRWCAVAARSMAITVPTIVDGRWVSGCPTRLRRIVRGPVSWAGGMSLPVSDAVEVRSTGVGSGTSGSGAPCARASFDREHRKWSGGLRWLGGGRTPNHRRRRRRQPPDRLRPGERHRWLLTTSGAPGRRSRRPVER